MYSAAAQKGRFSVTGRTSLTLRLWGKGSFRQTLQLTKRIFKAEILASLSSKRKQDSEL